MDGHIIYVHKYIKYRYIFITNIKYRGQKVMSWRRSAGMKLDRLGLFWVVTRKKAHGLTTTFWIYHAKLED